MPHLYLRGQLLSLSRMLIQPYRAKTNADYGINPNPSKENREQKCKARPASMFCIIPCVGFHSSTLKTHLHPCKQVARRVSDHQQNHLHGAWRCHGDYWVSKCPTMPEC